MTDRREWRISLDESNNTYIFRHPDGEIFMRCWPEQDFAVSLYFDYLDFDLSSKYVGWKSRLTTLIEASKCAVKIANKAHMLDQVVQDRAQSHWLSGQRLDDSPSEKVNDAD